MRKKLFVLFLSAVMVFSMAVPSFAITGIGHKVKYVAIGDSVGTGFNIHDTAEPKPYMEFIKFNQDDGCRQSRLDFVQDSYPAKVAKSIGIDEDASYNNAYCGLRAKDMCYILDLIGETEEFTINGKEGTQDNLAMLLEYADLTENPGMGFLVGDHPLQNLKKEINLNRFTAALQDADFISVELGMNDFTALMFNGTEDRSLFNAIYSALGKLTYVPEIQKMLEAIKAEEDSCEKTRLLCELIAKAKEMGVDLIKDVALLNDITMDGVKESIKYFDMLMGYIRGLNSTANIVVTNLYNPMVNSGFLEDETSNKILQTTIQPYLNMVSAHYIAKQSKYDYAVADISKVVPEEGNMFHPDMDGQTTIANAIVKKYKLLVLADLVGQVCKKQSQCSHSATKIVKQTQATYFAKGYTGDTVCESCGAVVKRGTAISKLVPEGTTISNLNPGFRKFTVTWNKSNLDGYQVQYSTSARFSDNPEPVTVADGTLSTTIKDLKPFKKYYVRVRTIKTVDNQNCYSKWSEYKTVLTW